MARLEVVIENGVARFVYDDALAPLLREGPSQTVRASHVEPHPTKTGWVADMGPSRGPVLGSNGPHTNADAGIAWDRVAPFATRQEALDAERAWLREHRGL